MYLLSGIFGAYFMSKKRDTCGSGGRGADLADSGSEAELLHHNTPCVVSHPIAIYIGTIAHLSRYAESRSAEDI